jgi:hypothetical protein
MSKRRAFVRGAARALDMGGSGKAVRSSRTGRYIRRSDAAAVAQDWQVVGGDLRKALTSVDRPALPR